LVAVCDVGQGTAVAIRAGPARAILVDAGPTDGRIGACLDALGVDRIAAMIVTHMHADHVGGAAEALRGRPVEVVVLPPPCGEETAERDLAALTDGARVVTVSSATARDPPVRGSADRVSFEVFPSMLDTRCRSLSKGVSGSGEDSSVNDASLAVHATVSGVGVWVLGDLESAGQAALLRSIEASGLALDRGSGLGREPERDTESGGNSSLEPGRDSGAASRDSTTASMTVVAHHGSAKQDLDLAASLAPDVAAFSAGADNDYGHPTTAALDLYSSVGAVIVRTDHDGHLVLREDGSVASSRAGVVPAPQREWH
jgi:competence protein ComEC